MTSHDEPEAGPVLTTEERTSAAASDQECEAMGEAAQRARAAGEHWPGWANVMHRQPAAWDEAHQAAEAQRTARHQERSADPEVNRYLHPSMLTEAEQLRREDQKAAITEAEQIVRAEAGREAGS
jgi:hypothetical protein